MVTNDMDFNPELGNRGADSNGLQERKLPGNSDLLSTDRVVATLRSAESPENLYVLLAGFVEANVGMPLIQTDRGKTLYFEYDNSASSLSVFIGQTDDLTIVGEHEKTMLFSMKIQEKYEFHWYSRLGFAIKQRFDASAIIDLASKQDDCPCADEPTLFFTAGRTSSCVLLTSEPSRILMQQALAPSFRDFQDDPSSLFKAFESSSFRPKSYPAS
ncbi:MAG: hypothetical protein K2X27_27975 [Candidatus Obscuribacterales bacterium]|nr:hypothetical protein [Candidatus Obscuribacterales bacterium]